MSDKTSGTVGPSTDRAYREIPVDVQFDHPGNLGLAECSVCGALVLAEDRHTRWHNPGRKYDNLLADRAAKR